MLENCDVRDILDWVFSREGRWAYNATMPFMDADTCAYAEDFALFYWGA
jgi:hypothetical protein